ncbi:AAA family ATPase [Cobetia marina]|uniref:AAA family ATPase n=1 Tax=Cobetia marina TaxID=28258 RepID=UPI0026E2C342|nr:AAA family ATPase [Cobetia marina]MDO6786789.1 AAA family ATPase [Cobetia marina]
MITEFFVLGLYEERNVRITFEDNCKVIVAENGYGKTTILNMLYSLLSGDTSKLRKVVFDSVGVTFRDGETISISKDELAIDHSGILNDTEYGFIELIGDDVLDALIEEERQSTLYTGYSNYSSGHRSSLFRSVVHKYDVSPARLRRYLRSFMAARKEEELKSPVQVKLAKVKEKFGYESLHLPTYRRVEEKAGYLPGLMSEELLDQSSINFGMSDVKKNIHDITSEIKTHL